MQLLLKGFELTKKINEEWIKQNCYIAGGCCVSNATRKPINDVDIYFKTKEARDEFIAELGDDRYFSKIDGYWTALLNYEYLLKDGMVELGEKTEFKVKRDGESELIKISSSFKQIYGEDEDVKVFQIMNLKLNLEIPYPLFEKQKWMFENGYDYVLTDRNHFEVNSDMFLGNKSITIKRNGMTYQFIIRFYGEPQKVMDETFDFQHCKIAYDLATNQYIASQETWECLSKREIKYVNSFYPISSMKRLFKYAGRKFTYTTDEFVKIIRDIHKIDVDNKYVIEDQLVGYYEDFDYNFVFTNEQSFNLENW